MDYVILLAGAFGALVAVLPFSSILTAVSRLHNANAPASMRDDVGGVSILRPVCGIENFIEETLQTTFRLDYPRYEVLFCAANANDPVIPIVRRLIAKYPHIDARLLIGNTEISPNPKLNNLVKGWHAAHHDWILMVHSNEGSHRAYAVGLASNHRARLLAPDRVRAARRVGRARMRLPQHLSGTLAEK